MSNGAKTMYDSVVDLFKHGLPSIKMPTWIPVPPALVVAKTAQNINDNVNKVADIFIESQQADVDNKQLKNQMLQQEIKTGNKTQSNKPKNVFSRKSRQSKNTEVETKTDPVEQPETKTEPAEQPETKTESVEQPETKTEPAEESESKTEPVEQPAEQQETKTEPAEPSETKELEPKVELKTEPETKEKKTDSIDGGAICFTQEECSFF